MVLILITIDPFARFGPMFQFFLTSTESLPQEPWFTTRRINKFNRPYANLKYKRASKPPCTPGILTSANFFWKQSYSPTRRTFYGNSYTAPTQSIHTIQQLGLAISKSYEFNEPFDPYIEACTSFYEFLGTKKLASWVGYWTPTLPHSRLSASHHWMPPPPHC